MAFKFAKLAGIAIFAALAFIFGFRVLHSYAEAGGLKIYVPHLSTSAQASDAWDVDLGKVRMLIEGTKRYQIDTDEGGKDWERLVPDDGGIIYRRNETDGRQELYTISMFHQLRCLNVVRLEIIRPTRFESHAPNEPQVKHCLNYLRQMTLCRSDPDLENPTSPKSVDVIRARTCNDWRKVYDATANQRARA